MEHLTVPIVTARSVPFLPKLGQPYRFIRINWYDLFVQSIGDRKKKFYNIDTRKLIKLLIQVNPDLSHRVLQIIKSGGVVNLIES